MNSIKDDIKLFLKKFNVSIVGFGTVPDTMTILEIEEKFPRTIVFGYRLSKGVLATIRDRPTLIYKHHYKTVNWLLDQTAYHLVRFIEEQGGRAIAIPASQTVDWEHQQGHMSHRHLAREAGLGFIGKSGLLVHPDYGAQVRYCSIVTDLEFVPDEKLIEENCHTCRKCIDVCPAQAITEHGVDLLRCYEKLKEFSRIKGVGQYICGVCVKVCDGSH
jgi:epoxyqueuosine reductase QueG